ncbi:hypothetical protein, partial [Streptomyces sp. NPDC005568]|uniref:hypothetical protein n=1 Tax=Streptomyces sp. NPDC005568 TaxID=3156887 RepID=UPI00339F50D4
QKFEAMPDDLRYARQVAERFGVDLHEIEIAPKERSGSTRSRARSKACAATVACSERTDSSTARITTAAWGRLPFMRTPPA